MMFSGTRSAILVAACCWFITVSKGTAIEERQAYALAGVGFDEPSQKLGNLYNYWLKYPNGTFDLTRSDAMPVTTPKILPFFGKRIEAIIEPSRSVLCIVDMQNFFLHPELSPKATKGRAAVEPTVNMINAFRKHGMKVTWVNWGLTNYDLLTIPPAFKSGFSGGSDLANETFGSDMGTIQENGTTIEVGQKLMRGAWNAEPWGVLGTMKDEGLAAGTDFLFHKNRLSGLWGPQTPYGQWLQENEITTIFFGGVNADQCVWSTFIDAYFKGKAPSPVFHLEETSLLILAYLGYDVVYVDDISATTSPEYASDMVRYNANGDGFLGNSTSIIAALDSSSCKTNST